MASSEDKNDTGPRRDEEPNPFVAFRRFADDQMGSILHNVLGFPLSFPSSTTPDFKYDDEDWQREAAEPRWRTRQETDELLGIVRALLKAQNQKIESQPAVFDEDDCASWPTSSGWMNRSSKAEGGLIRVTNQELPPGQKNAERANSTQSDSEQELMRCPYRLADQEGIFRNKVPQLSSQTSFYDTTPPTHSLPTNQVTGGPVFRYLLWSPYSPLRLERDSSLCNHPVAWRRAFEDLTGVRIQGEMPDQENFESGLLGDWRKGIGKSLRRFAGTLGPTEIMCATKADNNGQPDEVTELDLYERFLGTQYPQATSCSPAPARTSDVKPTTSQALAASTPADAPTPTPAIISTLTTTERNVFPDGSAHTKVVLKRRFADGREESTETVHTSHGAHAEGQGSAKPFSAGEVKDASKKEALEGIAQQAKKRGWFWS